MCSLFPIYRAILSWQWKKTANNECLAPGVLD